MPEYKAGELYLVADEKGYQVAKVLAVEPGIVHIRLYKNAFRERPSEIDLEKLELGRIDDPDGFGMGHVPLKPETFSGWGPELFMVGTVQPEELDGYNVWKGSNGGVWG